MTRNLLFWLVAVSSSAAADIGPDGAPIDKEYHACTNLDCSVYPSTKFHLKEKALSGKTVYGETFYAEKGIPSYKTIFTPQKINYVFNPSNGKIYAPGIDYLVTSEGLKLTPNSSIQQAPAGFSSTATPEEKKIYGVRVTTEFQQYQYAVTYEKQDRFQPNIIGSLGSIPLTPGTLPLKVTFFGDSITQGANSTEGYTAPFQPGYAGLVMSYLNVLNPGMWEYRNNSVGGWNTLNAVSAVGYRVMDKKSDLIVLGFGMNDSNFISPGDYKNNINKLISDIRTNQPKTPILLVSGTAANPNSSIQNSAFLNGYREVLKDVVNENELVAVADITSTWQMLLKHKNYYDITGNGLNHPNDFGHRVIAESVLSAILGPRY